MKLLLFSLLLTSVPPSDTLHTQRVRYLPSVFNTQPGTLILTDESVQFVARKKPERYNFTLSYANIHHIRRVWTLIFPNRTVIYTRQGERYHIYTYRRKQLFRIIAAKINRRK